jgi:hypothetical protein
MMPQQAADMAISSTRTTMTTGSRMGLIHLTSFIMKLSPVVWAASNKTRLFAMYASLARMTEITISHL